MSTYTDWSTTDKIPSLENDRVANRKITEGSKAMLECLAIAHPEKLNDLIRKQKELAQ